MFIDGMLLVGMSVMGLMLVCVGKVGYFIWKGAKEYE